MPHSKLLVLLTGVLALGLPLSAAATVPAGFTDVSLFNLGGPTALAFTPDGRLLVTTQGGTLRVYKNGALLTTPALNLAGTICTDSERGLLGVAVDPEFAANRYIYLYYTFDGPSACVNRVSRFTFGTGDTIVSGSEMVLLDNMKSTAGNHNGGDVHFGRDGYLYVSIGDGGCDWANNSGCGGANDASRDQYVLTGKILRITKTGGIPPTNPFQGAGTARCNVTGQTTPGNKCQETFSWGLRNPFRFAMDSNDAGTRFFINDVGQSAWEEIDLGQSGADFGWNCREGAHTNSTSGQCLPAPAGMVDPFFEYSRTGTVPGTSDTGCATVTGGAFVPDGVWPGYDGSYLFGDYICGKMFKITQGGGGVWSGVRFASNAGGFTAMTFGPHGNGQALYYLTFISGGQVHRVSFDTTGDTPPAASLSTDVVAGAPPLTVNFDGSASTDPDAGDVLTYFWDFGDGGPVLETSSPTTSHVYTSTGLYVATLKVRDDSFAFSAPVSVVIQPNSGPLDFNTVVPCRLVDTRSEGPALAAGSTRTFTATGTCDIPVGAKSVAVNLTVIGGSSGGSLRVWPAGAPTTTTSEIGFGAGQTRGNNALVTLSASGGFSVFADFPTGTAHLVVDVVGWFQ
jgi:glucose/arabinose dehydrogenase